MNWTNDTAAERQMTKFDVPFDFTEVNLQDIDFDESCQNSARLAEPISEDRVNDYALAMENGDVFPAIVLLKRKNKPYLILSGNHRGLAARKNNPKAKVKAYVVNTTDAMLIDILPRIFNLYHGERLSRDELVEHALYTAKTYGLTITQTEKMFGVKPGILAAEQRVRNLRDKLEKNGLDTSKIGKMALLCLAPIKNDNVLFAAGRLIANTRMTQASALEFATELKQKFTEASQMQVVAEYSGRMMANKKTYNLPGAVKSPRAKLLAALTMLEKNINGHQSLSQYQITEKHEIAKVKERISSVVDGLCKIGGIKTGSATGSRSSR